MVHQLQGKEIFRSSGEEAFDTVCVADEKENIPGTSQKPLLAEVILKRKMNNNKMESKKI